MKQKCALVMAGGTGGHIFPGLAVADGLRARGWRVHWLGAPGSMEQQLVPPRGYPFEAIDFGGVRGKGLVTLALLPLRLLRAFAQSIGVIRRVRPDVLVGLGGYITFPGGLMGVALGKPLVLHEQKSVAGMANRVLAGVADRVFTAFPQVLRKGRWIGNPLRPEFAAQPAPAQRFAGRHGPLRVLVVGPILCAISCRRCGWAAYGQLACWWRRFCSRRWAITVLWLACWPAGCLPRLPGWGSPARFTCLGIRCIAWDFVA